MCFSILTSRTQGKNAPNGDFKSLILKREVTEEGLNACHALMAKSDMPVK